jgi:ribosomal-protein-alanine N-acetyltransferase
VLALNFHPFPLLTTHRLMLRQVDNNDVNEIFFLRSDERVLKFLDRLPAASENEALELIQKINELEKSNDAITWAITLKEDAKLIGTICYWNILKEHHRAEIGYVLHPRYHGKGIMQEAMNEVLNYGFKIMKLHSIADTVNPGNEPSIKLLEKNGFIREAYFKEDYFFNGRFLDTVVYSLLASGI